MVILNKIESSTEVATKGNIRIFVKNQEHIPLATFILRDMEEHEYDTYAPKSIVTSIELDTELIYSGKFDFDIEDFTSRCNKDGIDVFIISINEYTYESGLTLGEYLEIGIDGEIIFDGQCEILANKVYRHERNPLEKLLHDKFKSEHINSDMDFIVFPPSDEYQNRPTDQLSNREKSIVLSTIQWLGTSVGKGFLHSVGFEHKKNK